MTSSSNQSSSTDLDDGLDVRSTAFAFFILALFSITAGVVGYRLTSFGLLFAGLPVSAVFTVLGGEFVVAWPVDAIVWIAVSAWPGRRAPGPAWWRTIAAVMVIALVYGWAMGLLVEPSTNFG